MGHRFYTTTSDEQTQDIRNNGLGSLDVKEICNKEIVMILVKIPPSSKL
jgi:hypothetical protein